MIKVSHNAAYLSLWAQSILEVSDIEDGIETRILSARLAVHNLLPLWVIKLLEKYPINEYWLVIDTEYEPKLKGIDFEKQLI